MGRGRLEIEADQRHVEIIVKELGLESAKGVVTPGVQPEDRVIEADDEEEKHPEDSDDEEEDGFLDDAPKYY